VNGGPIGWKGLGSKKKKVGMVEGGQRGKCDYSVGKMQERGIKKKRQKGTKGKNLRGGGHVGQQKKQNKSMGVGVQK